MALGALEILSVATFTMDYAARVMNAASSLSSSAGGCCSGGAMRYVLSFYGVVDLMSVLPFFLGLPFCGGLRDLSPKLLPTLVRRRVLAHELAGISEFLFHLPTLVRVKGAHVLAFELAGISEVFTDSLPTQKGCELCFVGTCRRRRCFCCYASCRYR